MLKERKENDMGIWGMEGDYEAIGKVVLLHLYLSFYRLNVKQTIN